MTRAILFSFLNIKHLEQFLVFQKHQPVLKSLPAAGDRLVAKRTSLLKKSGSVGKLNTEKLI